MKTEEYEIELTQGKINVLENITGIKIDDEVIQYGFFTVEVEVEITLSGFDGIGSYEFGSQTCEDKGEEVVEEYNVALSENTIIELSLQNEPEKAKELIDFLNTINGFEAWTQILADSDL